MGNQEVLGVAVTPNEEETEMRIKVYSWRDILLVSFPSVATLLEQRQEEPTISNIKQLLLTSDVDEFSTPAPPPTITVPSTSADSIEVVLLKMAEPLVPDDMAFFEQYCQEHLDPLVIADKEAKLHRKRRELLKTMSAGGAW
ncbi:DNA polymerase theta-like [Phytophthora cinnamomi]|uniref:DNA polymerase theta-like n=1 Tax=Phytophthora cinnamomi TaxID=4785 RepID=UPI00355ABBB3|nr:DNA polymerase theta-like [Phytophthora cinnamomi]